MSDDKGFDVVDKRRLNEETDEDQDRPDPDTPAEPSCEVAEEPDEEAAEAEPQPESKEDITPPNVYTVITWMIGMLASSAWQAMGLQIEQSSGKIQKDLEQAKVAIDCIMSLSDRVSAHLDESGRRELRGLVSDLQMNFVNQSKEA